MPNCLGPPPIFMPDDLSSKSGLTRTATRAGGRARCEIAASSSHLAQRLDVDQDARGHRLRAARPRDLPGPAKLISLRIHRRRRARPAARRPKRRRGRRPAAPCSPPPPASDWPSSRSAARSRAGSAVRSSSTTLAQQGAVVGVERRLPDPRGEQRQGDAADGQLAVDDGKRAMRADAAPRSRLPRPSAALPVARRRSTCDRSCRSGCAAAGPRAARCCAGTM